MSTAVLLPVFSRGNPLFISHWLETAEIKSSPFLSVELASFTEERHSPHPAFDTPNGGDTPARFFLSLPLSHTHSFIHSHISFIHTYTHTLTHSCIHTHTTCARTQKKISWKLGVFLCRWLKLVSLRPLSKRSLPFCPAVGRSVVLSLSLSCAALSFLPFFLSFSSPRSFRRFLRPSNGRAGRGNPASRSGKPHAPPYVIT